MFFAPCLSFFLHRLRLQHIKPASTAHFLPPLQPRFYRALDYSFFILITLFQVFFDQKNRETALSFS